MQYNFIENEEVIEGLKKKLVKFSEAQEKTMEIILYKVVPMLESRQC